MHETNADVDVDVVVLGGGLAGLCLALQLRTRFADLSIRVLERSAHPPRAGAHKVGESSVEINAHYLSHTLGLRAHLDEHQVRKFGFRFFFSDARSDIGNVAELGVSEVLPTPTWQIDRGVFEAFLAEEARRRGIEFSDKATVLGVDLAERGMDHVVRFRHQGSEHTLRARWLADASGRAGLLRRKLDLDVPTGHAANAVWLRIDARIKVDDWCSDADWQARCTPQGERWRSTNHLVGSGYWVWLIPLASGAHSIGIVADAALHPLESMNTFDKALDWLAIHQPLLARECAAHRDQLLDFRFLRNYSHGCKQMFSGDRWALTGDAGVFLDPFYSPGGDFIAIANTYICELVARDRAGQPVGPYARIYNDLYLSFCASTLTLYKGQYPVFASPTVLPLKVIWDYTYYWGVLCQIVFQQRLADIALLGELRPEFERAQALNLRMQSLFRAWTEWASSRNERTLLDQSLLPWFTELNRGLHDALDDAQVRARLRDNVELLERLAATIAENAVTDADDALNDVFIDLVVAGPRVILFAAAVAEAV
ncbi:MAG: FAD-dependent monooxygenase [Rhodanobacter sp.]